MPYIDQEIRKELDKEIDNLITILPRTLRSDVRDGDVNYVITRIIDGLYSNKDYSHYSRALGVLEAVKLEYYRRKIVLYEILKLQENKDVYK